MNQWIKDVVHNCIVHPLMVFMPVKIANEFHDGNARWAFGLTVDEMELEGKKDIYYVEVCGLLAQNLQLKDWHKLRLHEKELVSKLESLGYLDKKIVADGFVGRRIK